MSAQNARSRNNIPRWPAKVHWDFLLEEAEVFRKDMRLRRKKLIRLAKEAAACAKWGYEQRLERQRGSRQAWALYRRTTAIITHVTEEEEAEEQRILAWLAEMQHVDPEQH